MSLSTRSDKTKTITDPFERFKSSIWSFLYSSSSSSSSYFGTFQRQMVQVHRLWIFWDVLWYQLDRPVQCEIHLDWMAVPIPLWPPFPSQLHRSTDDFWHLQKHQLISCINKETVHVHVHCTVCCSLLQYIKYINEWKYIQTILFTRDSRIRHIIKRFHNIDLNVS